MAVRHIAVLGGGLTGLSATYHLSRRFPSTPITLLEKTGRLGGWVRSVRVDVPLENGPVTVLLETGPRTLRPRAPALLELACQFPMSTDTINLLGLQDSLICVLKTAPAAQARFLYDPALGLIRLPGSLLEVLQSPLRGMMVRGALRDLLGSSVRIGRRRSPAAQDASVEDFLVAHFGQDVARNLGSALIHGIYAADARKLSVHAGLGALWEAAERGQGSVLLGLLLGKGDDATEPTCTAGTYMVGGVADRLTDVSLFSFRTGLETLPRSLEDHLRLLPNVQIRVGAEVHSLRKEINGSWHISTSTGELQPTHVVSALPLPALNAIVNAHIPHLNVNPCSTVYVVNLVFPVPRVKIHPEGFGYLIPRPKSGYPLTGDESVSKGQNAASSWFTGILGTVFDSCSLHEQDISASGVEQMREGYYVGGGHTKLTIMVGGPYEFADSVRALHKAVGGCGGMLEGYGDTFGETPLPPPLSTLLDALSVHLGHKVPPPVYWRISQQKDCIPTLLPGHPTGVRDMQDALRAAGGRLDVIGGGAKGVSIGDCLEAGRSAGLAWHGARE